MSIIESRVQFSIQHFWHVDSIAWYWRFSAFTALQAQSSREIIAGFDNGAASWRWSSKVQFSNGLKRVANIGKPKGMRQSPKSPPPPQKKKRYNGITFFLKTGDLDSLRLSFLTWTEIKESQVMQSRPGGPDLWSTHLLPPIFDRWLHLRWKQTLPEPWAFIVQKFSEKFWSSFHRLIPMVSQPLASQKLGRTLDCGWLNQSRHCEDDPVLKLTEIET